MAKIPGTAVASPLVPIDSSSTTPTHSARYGKGGLRGVATIAALDDIPASHREHGMLVFVEALGAYYQCGPGPVFSFGAAPFVPGPSADTIYPNTSSGLAAVGEGEYFYVATSEGLKLYRDVAGAASFVGDFPSLATLSAEVAAAAASVVAAGEAQGLAESARNEATEQAGIATTQAVIATNQAGIATTQAGEAANQAGVASGHATQSGIFRDQARAAADATAPQRFFDTYADALAAISTIPDDAVIEVFEDETQDDYRTRYLKEPGNLVLKIRFEADTIRTDLGSNDPGKGAQLVANSIVKRDNIAQMQALIGLVDGQRLSVGGYYDVGDGGRGEFVYRAASTATVDNFLVFPATGMAGAGRIHRIINDGTALFEQAGAVGNGVADDTARFAAAAASGVPRLESVGGKTYLLTDVVTFESPTIINLNGSVCDFQLTTTVPAFHIKSDDCSISNGSIFVTGTTMGGEGNSLNCVYVGERGLSAFGYKNIYIGNLRVSCNRNDAAGACIGVQGGSSNIVIENIEAPDAVNSPNIIGVEWKGTVLDGTQHPNNITIRNVKIGRIDSTFTHMVWISSCFNVSIENVWAEKIGNGFQIYAGDRANEAALPEFAPHVGKGIKIKNAGCFETIQEAVNIFGKGPSATSMLPLEAELSNLHFKSNSITSSATNQFGVHIEQTSKFEIKKCTFDGFFRGIFAGAFVKDFTIEDVVAKNSWTQGMLFGISTVGQQATNGLVRKCEILDNNRNLGSSVLLGSGVVCYSENMTFDNLFFMGDDHVHSLALLPPSTLTRVINCYTATVAAGGFALVNDVSTNATIQTIAFNNRAASGIGLFAGAPVFYQENHARVLSRTTAPTVGTYNAGDRVYNPAPVAGGKVGFVCVTGGSPGTWKPFGAIDP